MEEVARRGFALLHLQKRYSAFVASMIIGVLWAVWHAPLLFNLDNVMSTYPLLPWFVDAMMDSVIYVWLYNSIKGSVFLLVLYHALSNTLGGFAGWSTATASIVIAALLLLIYKPATISANSRKYSLSD
ncbi:CAAX amino terminal protease family protein [Aerococcus viridans ATCC 11563 = CCUG 4311]|uniref:CAAX amino terminal protease family protein n=1 Tax=Aerococcus viridans (strain ATCC 11563 / DSM 20340 / CCUG 4311 / JCM 20461 / NBRC 12219 / NCTC 8251 / M1) TaxID=655812 RepID=A0ABP2I517_AERVM|nr:CAAX amino terminal protease family protein [Aerococcus viridans ATCC 11563 = CCUG 4311]